jgi:hypothetical protein
MTVLNAVKIEIGCTMSKLFIILFCVHVSNGRDKVCISVAITPLVEAPTL